MIKRLTSFAFSLSTAFLCQAAQGEPTITICNDTFPPFVGGDDISKGDATRQVLMVLDHAGYNAQFEQHPYEYCRYKINNGERVISFPWIATEQRRDDGADFTQPFYTASVALYYSIQNEDAVEMVAQITGAENLSQLNSLPIGVATGYEYGSTIRDLISTKQNGKGYVYKENIDSNYASPTDLIEALLDGEIAFAPMIERVMAYHKRNQFADQKGLLEPVPNISSNLQNALMVPNTEWGQDVKDKLDRSFNDLQNAEVLFVPPEKSNPPYQPTKAIITGSDDEPIIIAFSDVTSDRKKPTGSSFALFQGTEVIILDRSPELGEEAERKSVYPTMMGNTRVVVLNGQHTGKTLYVRNKYLSLVP